MKYLVLGDPCGSHVFQMVNKNGVDPNDISVWEDSTKGQHCVRVYGVNNVTDNLKDFDGMKFDVIIGNPPYQRPREVRNIGAPIWPEFIETAINLIDSSGTVKLIVPATWLKRLNGKAWNVIRSNNLIACDPDVKWAFPDVGGNGGTFSFVTIKSGKYEGRTSIRGEFNVDIVNDILPTNNKLFTLDNIEFLRSNTSRLLKLKVYDGPVNPSINSDSYSFKQSNRHKYNIYYSGQKDRRSMWCTRPVGHCGELKLVIPNSGNLYQNMEITTKGAGRQTSYVLGTREELEHIKEKMLTDDSIQFCRLMAEGNYRYPLKYVLE